MKREDAGDQDAIWQAIVDNYGERVLDDLADEGTRIAEPAGETAQRPGEAGDPAGADSDVEDTDLVDTPEPDLIDALDALDEAERFVPDAPPVPIPSVDRLLAWAGVLGSPVVLLAFLLLGLSLPTVVAWILVVGFVAGFCYLVARMPGGPRDPWDDGARV